MDYRRFGNKIVARFDINEEILESLEKIAIAENIKLASVSAIGAVNEFIVGAYDVPSQKYNKKEFKGTFEIVSLLGNISTMNNEYYAHLHLSASDVNCNVYGGHLNKAIISATCELIINVIEGNVDRFHDKESTGLNLFKF